VTKQNANAAFGAWLNNSYKDRLNEPPTPHTRTEYAIAMHQILNRER